MMKNLAFITNQPKPRLRHKINRPLRGASIKGNIMKYNFENVIAEAPQDWDNDLLSLPDDLKDLAVYSWLEAYPSWIEDYIPEACYEHGPMLIYLLYNKPEHFEAVLETVQRIYAKRENIKQEDHEDVFWHTNVGDLKDFFNYRLDHRDNSVLSFTDNYRDAIYLSMEDTLRDKLLSAQGLCDPCFSN